MYDNYCHSHYNKKNARSKSSLNGGQLGASNSRGAFAESQAPANYPQYFNNVLSDLNKEYNDIKNMRINPDSFLSHYQKHKQSPIKQYYPAFDLNSVDIDPNENLDKLAEKLSQIAQNLNSSDQLLLQQEQLGSAQSSILQQRLLSQQSHAAIE